MTGRALLSVQEWSVGTESVGVGRIVSIDQHGRALVSVAGQGDSSKPARSLIQITASQAEDLAALPPVLVLSPSSDGDLPIIIGWVQDRIVDQSSPAPVSPLTQAVADGKRIMLRAECEIVLSCGTSSIVLTKDGKVVIKGAHVVSRSSGPNKIKGATVDIN